MGPTAPDHRRDPADPGMDDGPVRRGGATQDSRQPAGGCPMSSTSRPPARRAQQRRRQRVAQHRVAEGQKDPQGTKNRRGTMDGRQTDADAWGRGIRIGTLPVISWPTRAAPP